MDDNRREGLRRFFASRTNLVLLGFLGVGGFLLVAEHWAHLVGVGPFLLLLGLCGGMHFFMHGTHGGHGGTSSRDDRTTDDGASRDPGADRTDDRP